MNYLDANASARPCIYTDGATPKLGNPSSAHRAGQFARAQIEDARETIAAFLETKAGRLVFTSGGSESVMTALWAASPRYKNLYYPCTDHPITHKSSALLAKRGIRSVDIMRTDRYAIPVIPQLSTPAIVSLQVAHSELGTILSPEWLTSRFGTSHSRSDILLHLDCCQALGKIPIGPYLQIADFASFSGHKLGAPAGTGLLYIREGIGELDPLIPGEQEWKRRGGTENSHGILGLAATIKQRLSDSSFTAQIHSWQALTRTLRVRIAQQFQDIQVLSPEINHGCLPQTTFIRIPGLRSNYAVIAFDKRGIAVSAGTACRSGLVSANETALALGFSETEASEMLRISLDWGCDESQVDHFIHALGEIRAGLR